MAEIGIKTEYLPDQRAGRDAPSIIDDGNRLSERTRKNARNVGLAGPAAVVFAWYSAAKSENLKASGMNAPLGPAWLRFFSSIAAWKYNEIGNHPNTNLACVAVACG